MPLLRILSIAFVQTLVLGSTAVSAQTSNAELPALARRMDLSLALPTLDELTFDTTEAKRLRQPTHLRWRHRGAEAFEIYVQLLPERAARPLMPHVLSGAALTDCARNSEQAADFIARYRAGDEELERLGADWASIWAFRPKPEFSGREHALQVSYYREGSGVVNLWLLSDDRELMNGAWPYLLPFAAGEEVEEQ